MSKTDSSSASCEFICLACDQLQNRYISQPIGQVREIRVEPINSYGTPMAPKPEQIQPGFELIFKGVKYRFGMPFNDRWNRFQAEWGGVMEKRREFLDTCARNNAVRPNVSRRVVSTPNGIESVPSAAA